MSEFLAWQGENETRRLVFEEPAGGFVGREIAHYTLVRELGRGGQGCVYLAKDRKLHRNVALKILQGVSSIVAITTKVR